MTVTEKTPTRLDLSLNTPMRYFDGSPRWDMVMVSADLTDYMTIGTYRHPVIIRIYTGNGFLSNDQRNLVYQAAHISHNRFHCKDGVAIRIKRQIPVAAGLGGGSSGVAVVLRALSSIWRLGLSLLELAEIALAIDSNVPYCMYSRLAHATGHSEKVELLLPQPHYWTVATKQKINVSAPQILRQINYERLQHLNNEALLINLKEGDWQETTKYVGDILEPLTMKFYPEIDRLENKMKGLGADITQMSETELTAFATCHTESRVRRIQNSVWGFCRDVHIATLL